MHQQLKSQDRIPALALALLPTSGSGLSSLTMLEVLGMNRWEKKRIGFSVPPLGFQEKIKWSAGSWTPRIRARAGNPPASHCKGMGFISLAETRPSFCSPPHCFFFFFSLAFVGVGGVPALPEAMSREVAVPNSSWPLSSEVVLNLVLGGPFQLPRWRIGSEQFCGKGNGCC